MKKIAFALYALLCVIMAAATFFENSYGTELAHKYIYGSWWFILLWAVAIILSVPCFPKHFMWIKKFKRTDNKDHEKTNGQATKIGIILLVLHTSFFAIQSMNAAPKCVKLEQAEELKTQQVVYNGRICPLNTVARDFTQKITGKHSFRGLTAEQILISWTLHPEDWKDVKMIKVKKAAALRSLGVEGDRASFADFFDANQHYRFKAGEYPDIEEKLSIIIMATRGQLFEPLPSGCPPISDTKVKAEILYNSISWNLILFICSFVLAILSFEKIQSKLFEKVQSKLKVKVNIPKTGAIIVSAALVFCLVLRWYVANHLPLTNTFETMQVVALSTLLIACASDKWRTYAFIVSGATLLVTHISSLDPQITPLMPALQSPWLASHVTTIMISYALYAILLFRPDRTILIWAEILLGVGIILGSIWAKDAWGTFWSWDPKETWALITLIVYMYPLHTATLPWFRDSNHQKWYLRFAFLTILMTYFGCNYILTGMHSYANS